MFVFTNVLFYEITENEGFHITFVLAVFVDLDFIDAISINHTIKSRKCATCSAIVQYLNVI